MHIRRVLGILFVLLVLVPASSAQFHPRHRPRDPEFSSSFNLKNWGKEEAGAESSIMQITTPVTIVYPVRSFTLAVTSATVFSSLDAEVESEMNGVTDTQLRCLYGVAGDSILIGLGMNLPSGRSSLSGDEREVSRTLSDHILGFERNRLGGGFDVDFSLGVARAVGPVAIGGGVGYVLKGEYDYLQDKDAAYEPGNELSLNAGADLAIGHLIVVSDISYSMYSSSKLDGDEVFKEGGKLSAGGSLFYSIGPVTLSASARDIMRGEIEDRSSTGALLIEQEEKSVGDQLDLKGVVYLRTMKSKLILKALTEARFIGENGHGEGEASAIGFGVGFRMTPFMGIVMELTGKYLMGQADDGDTSLDGFAATFSLRREFWQ